MERPERIPPASVARAALGLVARLLVAALVVSGPAGLLALAFASPDPAWPPGLYDAERDDPAAPALSASANPGLAAAAPAPPGPSGQGPVAPAIGAGAPASSASGLRPRAPPAGI